MSLNNKLREFGQALATAPVGEIGSWFTNEPVVYLHSTKTNSLDVFVEWLQELRGAFPVLRFDTVIALTNEKNEGILVGYFIGEHTGQLRNTAPKNPPQVVRMIFGAMVEFDDTGRISHLYANQDREHCYEQVGLISNTFIKVVQEEITLDNHADERTFDQTLSAELQQKHADAIVASGKALQESDVATAMAIYNPDVVVNGSKMEPKNIEIIRAGMNSRLSLSKYDIEVVRVITCGRITAECRSIVFDNMAKKFGHEGASDFINCTTITVAYWNDDDQISEIWGINDGVSVQEQFLNSKLGAAPPEIVRTSTFPIEAASLTNEFLTEVIVPAHLQEQGVKIVGFTLGEVGDIHGFAGSSSVIKDIQYEGADPSHDLPQHAFAKFPLPHTNSVRMMLKSSKIYKREVLCYQHILSKIPGFSYAHCFKVDYDNDTDDFVLILENLNRYYRVGDQIASCELRYAKAMARQLGLFHGSYWESPELDTSLFEDFKDIIPIEPRLETMSTILPVIFEHFGDRITSEIRDRVQNKLIPNIQHVFNSLAPCKTLSNGDFRLDNMFLKKEDSPDHLPDVVIVDFQIASVSTTTNDVVGLFITNFSPQLLRDHRDEIFNHYIDAAIENGAKWTREQFREQFNVQILLGIAISFSICASMISQSKAGGDQVNPRLRRMIDEFGNRALAACDIEQFWEHLDKLLASRSASE